MYQRDLAKLIRPPFSDLLPAVPAVLDAVTEAMTTYGYDQSQPVLVWKEGQALIDGHTRLKAAVQAGIHDIPVHYKSFATEDEALAYAIHLQRNRRNLTDAEIIRCIEALDRRKQVGRPSEKLASNEANFKKGKSAQETAKVVGVSSDPAQTLRHDPTTIFPALINALEGQTKALERIGKELTLLRREKKKLAKKRTTRDYDLTF